MPVLEAESASRRLRDATAEVHRRVEDGVDILRRTESVGETVELLRRMEAFYRAFEPLLAARLAGRVPGEYLEARLPRLHADLGALSPGWRPLPVPAMPEMADALGGLYVLEGAALGGQVIARHLLARLGFRSAFFGGEGVGPRWRAFRAILDEAGDAEGMIDAAKATFEAFERAVVLGEVDVA